MNSKLFTESESLCQFLEALRFQGVSEFACPEFQVKFGENSALKNPITDNTSKPDSVTASKRDEVKDEEDLLFHSTPFGGD